MPPKCLFSELYCRGHAWHFLLFLQVRTRLGHLLVWIYPGTGLQPGKGHPAQSLFPNRHCHLMPQHSLTPKVPEEKPEAMLLSCSINCWQHLPWTSAEPCCCRRSPTSLHKHIRVSVFLHPWAMWIAKNYRHNPLIISISVSNKQLVYR